MNDDAVGGEVENPVFGDTGAGVEGGFCAEVVVLGNGGDFGDEEQVRRRGILGAKL